MKVGTMFFRNRNSSMEVMRVILTERMLMKPIPFLLLLATIGAFQSCGGDGGSSSGGSNNTPQSEDTSGGNTNESESCSFAIMHPDSDGTTINCFSLTVAETNTIIKTELAQKNYAFKNDNAAYIYESSPVCVQPEEGAETVTSLYSSVLDGNGARVYYEGQGTASEWREADALALRDSLKKIPRCNE